MMFAGKSSLTTRKLTIFYIVNFNFKLRSRSKVRSKVRSSRSSSKLKDLHMGMCYTVYTNFGLPPSTQPANCP